MPSNRPIGMPRRSRTNLRMPRVRMSRAARHTWILALVLAAGIVLACGVTR
jgi:hypothetical protein